MNYFFSLTTALLFFILPFSHNQKRSENSKENLIDKKVKALISKMTLEEKVGQMTQVSLQVVTKKRGDVLLVMNISKHSGIACRILTFI